MGLCYTVSLCFTGTILLYMYHHIILIVLQFYYIYFVIKVIRLKKITCIHDDMANVRCVLYNVCAVICFFGKNKDLHDTPSQVPGIWSLG